MSNSMSLPAGRQTALLNRFFRERDLPEALARELDRELNAARREKPLASELLADIGLEDQVRVTSDVIGKLNAIQFLSVLSRRLEVADVHAGRLMFTEVEGFGLHLYGVPASDLEKTVMGVLFEISENGIRDFADAVTNLGHGDFFLLDLNFETFREDFILRPLRELGPFVDVDVRF